MHNLGPGPATHCHSVVHTVSRTGPEGTCALEKKMALLSERVIAGCTLQCSAKCMKSKKKTECHRHVVHNILTDKKWDLMLRNIRACRLDGPLRLVCRMEPSVSPQAPFGPNRR